MILILDPYFATVISSVFMFSDAFLSDLRACPTDLADKPSRLDGSLPKQEYMAPLPIRLMDKTSRWCRPQIDTLLAAHQVKRESSHYPRACRPPKSVANVLWTRSLLRRTLSSPQRTYMSLPTTFAYESCRSLLRYYPLSFYLTETHDGWLALAPWPCRVDDTPDAWRCSSIIIRNENWYSQCQAKLRKPPFLIPQTCWYYLPKRRRYKPIPSWRSLDSPGSWSFDSRQARSRRWRFAFIVVTAL